MAVQRAGDIADVPAAICDRCESDMPSASDSRVAAPRSVFEM